MSWTCAYRKESYKSLCRYPQKHQPIPKNIFSKISRLYPSEPPAAKHIVMNIVLDLIHTDIMRDKLFAFIRSNYNDEDPEMKQIIITDLCRVFYGGFLQAPLLTFFSEQFVSETEETKSLIVDKLLLSIRTPAVQCKILAFFEQQYANLSLAHKDRFYHTFMEMLPEHDALANSLVQLVNRFVLSESVARKKAIAKSLTNAVEADYRKKEHLLMPLLVKHKGFSSDLIISLAFGSWHARKLHEEYLLLLQPQPPTEKADVLVSIFDLVKNPDQIKILTEFSTLFQGDYEQSNLTVWLDVYDRIAALPSKFADQFNATVILPAVCRTVNDALDHSRYPDAMHRLDTYANRYPAVSDVEQYVRIKHLRSMCDAAIHADYSSVDRHLSSLLKSPSDLHVMASYMEAVFIDPPAMARDNVIALRILVSILRDGNVGLDKIYRLSLEGISHQQCMELMISVCTPMIDAGPALAALLSAADSGLPTVVSTFTDAHGKGTLHWLHSHLQQGSSFAALVEDIFRVQKKASGSFLSKLLRRK